MNRDIGEMEDTLTDNENVALVRRGYEAFNTADVATLSALIADDAVQHVPGSSQIAGDYKGRDAILVDLYAKIAELTGGSVKAELESVTAEGDDKVVAVHRARATRGSKQLDGRTTLVFTVKDGTFVDLEEHWEDEAAGDEFWA